MIPRSDLTELLQKRLQEYMPKQKLQELITDILALEEGWEELEVSHRDMGYSMSVNCPDICFLADQIDQGSIIKLFRKRKAKVS